MDEEISIIDSNTRNEKIKNFLTNNKKKIISSVLILVILVISIYSIDTYKKQAKLKLADKYNFAVINFKPENSQKIIEDLTEIVKANDTTYSPLALYFLIDNNLIENQEEINQLFDEVINKTKLDKEIKNLLSTKFDREVLVQLLGVDKIDIDEILRNCNFSDTFIEQANDLQIMEAINECYDEYKLLQF